MLNDRSSRKMSLIERKTKQIVYHRHKMRFHSIQDSIKNNFQKLFVDFFNFPPNVLGMSSACVRSAQIG